MITASATNKEYMINRLSNTWIEKPCILTSRYTNMHLYMINYFIVSANSSANY